MDARKTRNGMEAEMRFEIILHIENGTVEVIKNDATTREAAEALAAEHATWQGPYEQVTRTEIVEVQYFAPIGRGEECVGCGAHHEIACDCLRGFTPIGAGR
jgi:hypothetical protein